MPYNPRRSALGGDVEGTTLTDVTMGKPVEVSSASFDGGYPEQKQAMDHASMADLKQGYCSYGKSIGEGRRKN